MKLSSFSIILQMSHFLLLSIPEFDELEAYCRGGILTRQQIDIIYRHVNIKSYKSTKNVYQIFKSTVARAITRTASCRPWQKGQKAGGMTLLSPPDEAQFKKLTQEMCFELNCITTAMIEAICCELQNCRVKFASKILIAAHSPHLLANLDDICLPPSRGLIIC